MQLTKTLDLTLPKKSMASPTTYLSSAGTTPISSKKINMEAYMHIEKLRKENSTLKSRLVCKNEVTMVIDLEDKLKQSKQKNNDL